VNTLKAYNAERTKLNITIKVGTGTALNKRKHRKQFKRILPVISSSKAFILALLTALIIPSFISPAYAQTPDTEEQTWTVNFRDADIEELIRFVA